ncbi:MAG: oxidative damage protection protein [Legionellales bacterium]|nr:oxidative damage protection protein [Legionellales bacterium]
MTRTVFCSKLQQELPGFERPPYPGAMGQKIYQSISKQAWQMWVAHQTMLINEYHLSTLDPKARQFLLEEMEKFLFGEGSAKPAGFVPRQEE